MQYPTIRPPHSKQVQEVLRKAGMSKNSELTEDEMSGIRSAKVALEQNPRLSQNRVYRIIRPLRTDEFDV